MADQPVREIQLGGKQLVFLFMASVVLAVAIFLLGISVGRGVHSAEGGSTSTDVAVDPSTPLPDLPPTETTAADLKYHDQLQGQNTPAALPQAGTAAPVKPAEEAPSVADDAPAAPQPASAPVPKAGTAATAKLVEKPREKPAAKAAETVAKAGAAAAAGGWFVQVDSFRSRSNAESQATKLKAKKYAAAVTQSASLYRVRVGPFAERADAERVRQRLIREEGLKPSIQR